MSAEKFSSRMSDSINMRLDGKNFDRVLVMHTSTVAQLRSSLSRRHKLPSNTSFLDTDDYPLAKEDEALETIKVLLRLDNTILIRTDEILSERNMGTATSTARGNERRTLKKSVTFVITELISIFEWLWYLILKPLVVFTLMFLLLYYGYTKTICRHGRFLPLVTMYCPIDEIDSIAVPPMSKLANHTVSIADTLINADASAPMRFVQAKTSLVKLRYQVTYSDIDVGVREKLSEQMGELQKLIQIGADRLTSMLSSFGGTLDKLRIYTQFALEDLSKVINQGVNKQNNQLQIGYSEMQARDMLTKSFNDYMASVADQTDKILVKAQEAHMSLEMIKDKLETIQELNFKGRHISQKRIDELKHGSFWSWLFDEGKLGIVKHERNLDVLDGFIRFVNAASNNVNDVIIKLKIFKNDAEELKQTGVLLEQLPDISVNRHAQLLETALKRLSESKEKFEGKLQQANRPNEIS